MRLAMLLLLSACQNGRVPWMAPGDSVAPSSPDLVDPNEPAEPDGPLDAEYSAQMLATALDRLQISRHSADGLCARLMLVSPVETDWPPVETPSGWSVERAFAGPAAEAPDCFGQDIWLDDYVSYDNAEGFVRWEQVGEWGFPTQLDLAVDVWFTDEWVPERVHFEAEALEVAGY